MSDSQSQVILHNYPQSPVAEKIRVAVGIKNLNWFSVQIPRILPKPLLVKLTGGYRRTPVMQIGSDIYCDSHCIITELERRFPDPTFYPTADAGLIKCLSRWTDTYLFDLATQIVLGSAIDDLPPDFAADRGRLYFGDEWEEGMRAAKSNLPHLSSQMRGPLSWINDQLSDGRNFLLGSTPGAIDAQFFCIVWFLRGRWNQGPVFLSQFPELIRWEQNIIEVGHGSSSELQAEEAIKIAANHKPIKIETSFSEDKAHDLEELKIGSEISIIPDVDGGETPVTGKLLYASSTKISLHKYDKDIGDSHIHFPRTGYSIKKL